MNAATSSSPPQFAAHPDSASAGAVAAMAGPRIAIPLLLVLGLILFVANLGGYPLYTKGEPREAVTIFDIVHGGGWILPMRAGVEIPSKPLMMHWIAAVLSLAAGGVNEWTVRLPSALLAIAGILASYLYVRRLFDERSALLAALMLATSVQYLQAGSGARVDMTLTFFMEIAFFEFILIAEGLTRRRIPLYLAIAAAVLSKGPVGLILPAATALIWIAIERRWALLRALRIAPGAAIVAILAGGWYLAAAAVGGRQFIDKQILAENVLRFFGNRNSHQGHAHPFYYVELALLAGFMPWTILLPAPAVRLIRARDRLGPRLRYLIVWFVTVLVFYNVARSKRGVYLLALYPALTSILAVSLTGRFSEREGSARWPSAFAALGGLALAGAGIAGLAGLVSIRADQALLRGLLARADIIAPGLVTAIRDAAASHLILAILIPLATGALGAWLVAMRPAVETTVSLIAAGFAGITLAANLFVVPAIARTLTLEQFTGEAMRIVDGSSVGYLNALNYNVAFYSRRNIPIVAIGDPNLPEYLLGWRAGYESIPDAERKRFTAVLVSGPTDLDNGGGMVLLRRALR